MDALSLSAIEASSLGGEAIVSAGETLRYDELAVRARRLARVLLDPIDAALPIAFVASSCPASIALVAACLDRAQPVSPIHPRLGEAERARALEVLGQPRWIEATELEEAWSRTRTTGDDPMGMLAATRPAGSTELAVTLLTSGTTSAPRAVELSRDNLLASAQAHARNVPFVAQDRWLVAMPLAHAGGLSILTRSIAARTAVLVQPRFDPDEALAAIERERVTLLSVVPTMLRALLERDARGALRRCRAILVGGAAFPTELRDESLARGLRTLATYGLTETCSQLTTESPGAVRVPEERHSGAPLHGAEVRIVDEREERCATNVPGRILVRGPMRMRGYRGDRALEAHEWFDTRDSGYLDEAGRLVVLGRVDDTIVTGGENVHPSEVEDALRHAGALDALVFGIDEPRWGAVVAAAIVLRDDAPESALDRVLVAASARLASFKRPRLVVRVDRLPLGTTGKPDRRAARALFADRLVSWPTPSVPR